MDSINDKYNKRTKYDAAKECKRENFSFLNKKYLTNGCTVLIGDSITEKYNADFFFDYTARTGKYVFNRGIDGDTSDRMFERLQDNVISLKPGNIVILIGTNDFGIGAPVEFAFCNIEKSINYIKGLLPDVNIILEAVYPVNKSISVFSSPVGKRDNEVIRELNSRLEKLAQTHDITFLDMTGELADKKGRLDKGYTYDGLHLNAQGYSVVTEKLIPLLK